MRRTGVYRGSWVLSCRHCHRRTCPLDLCGSVYEPIIALQSTLCARENRTDRLALRDPLPFERHVSYALIEPEPGIMKDQGLGGEANGLAKVVDIGVSEEVEVGKSFLAGVEMGLEDVQAIGPFDQFHRGSIAWIDLKRIDGLIPQDKIDSIDAYKVKLPSDSTNDLSQALDQVAPFGLPSPHRPEDTPTVAKAVRSELDRKSVV